MFVCVCNAITEQKVLDVIREGATTRAQVTAHCSAGGDCGACHGAIEDMIDDHQHQHQSSYVAASALVRPSRAA